jgi:hypothetical protein
MQVHTCQVLLITRKKTLTKKVKEKHGDLRAPEMSESA